jgi:hypothetical protein
MLDPMTQAASFAGRITSIADFPLHSVSPIVHDPCISRIQAHAKSYPTNVVFRNRQNKVDRPITHPFAAAHAPEPGAGPLTSDLRPDDEATPEIGRSGRVNPPATARGYRNVAGAQGRVAVS